MLEAADLAPLKQTQLLLHNSKSSECTHYKNFITRGTYPQNFITKASTHKDFSSSKHSALNTNNCYPKLTMGEEEEASSSLLSTSTHA
jgi:hypothetical protein